MTVIKLNIDGSGLAELKAEEAQIDGLYDDPSRYCTYGVGHLVHRSPSVLLAAAIAKPAWAPYVKKQWPGTKSETIYLDRSVRNAPQFKEFVASVAQGANLKKAHDEAKVLDTDADTLLRKKVVAYENIVRSTIKFPLTQAEYNALVSFVYNIGDNFKMSTVAKLINQQKYNSGSASARHQACDEIEAAFKMWNKSGGKVLKGLEKRRQREADRFLKGARAASAASPTTSPLAGPKPKSGSTISGLRPPAAHQTVGMNLFSYSLPNAQYCPTFPIYTSGRLKVATE